MDLQNITLVIMSVLICTGDAECSPSIAGERYGGEKKREEGEALRPNTQHTESS